MKIADALSAVPDLVERHHALAAAAFEDGSCGARDVGLSAELGHEAWDLATDQLASSLDHLVAWHRLILAGIQPSFAHLTLVRGSMEATVTARWLLDATLEPSERVGRAVGLLWYDYEERRKAENAMEIADKIVPPAMSAARRIAELEEGRLADNIPAISYPPMTRLFELYAVPAAKRGESLYRILSAHAHSRRWRLLMNPSTDTGSVATTGAKIMKVTAGDQISAEFTQMAVRWVARAIGEAEGYMRNQVVGNP
jgi:hypothetical protein